MRSPSTRIVQLGGLALALLATGVAQATGAGPAMGTAVACASAVAASFMLHGIGLRLMGVVITALGIGGTAAAVLDDTSARRWLVVLLVLVATAGCTMAVRAPEPRRRRGRSEVRDPWKDMDAGLDPTLDDDSR